jgi:hypothetical protein
MSNEEKYFDKIIHHLNRKKPKPTWNSDGKPVKANYYFQDMLDTEHKYIQMIVDYNYIHMAISYICDKRNPYKVWIEKQCVIRQTIGTRFWEDTWYAQEDVIEYIRYKLR